MREARPNQTGHTGERGLTLVELIVTITILAILASAAVPMARLRPYHPELALALASALYGSTFILVQEGKKMAVVDNQFVKEGDAVNGKKIARIDKDRVLLRGKGGEGWLFVAREEARESGPQAGEKKTQPAADSNKVAR